MSYVISMLEGRWPTRFVSSHLLSSLAFDGRSFRPHGIIPSFPVQLGEKTMCVK
jgi:hypothetical protein